MIAAASITVSAAHAGVNTRFVTTGIDLRGPDVAANTLRWLATVEPDSDADARRRAAGCRRAWLLVIVTGLAGSPAAAHRPVDP